MRRKDFSSAVKVLSSEETTKLSQSQLIEIPVCKVVKFPKTIATNLRKFDFSKYYDKDIEQIVAVCQRAIELLVDKSISSDGTTLSISSILGYCTGGLVYFLPYCQVVSTSLGRPISLKDINKEFILKYVHYLDGLELSDISKKNAYSRAKAVITEVGRMKYLSGNFYNIFPKNPYPSVARTAIGSEAYSDREFGEISRALKRELTKIFKKDTALNGYETNICFLAIAMRTGLNSTPLLELPVDCIQDHPLKANRKLLVSYKRRGKSSHAVLIRKTEEIASINTVMPDVAAVVDLVIRLNKSARDALSSQFLFTYIPSYNYKKPTHLSAGSSKRLAADFGEKNLLVSDKNEPLSINVSRMRKTFVSRIWRLSNQDPIITAAMAGHSLKVSNDYYLEPPPEAEKNFSFMGEVRVIELVDRSKRTLESTPSGACSDPKGGDLAPKNGTHCISFLSCFRCRSFVVTENDLYRVFSLYYLLVKQKKEISKKKWSRYYSHIIRVIDRDIASRFDPSLVNEVRRKAINGFYPDFADTSKKPDNGQKECLCRREENTAPSSNRVLLNKRGKRVLAVPRLHMNWVLPPVC